MDFHSQILEVKPDLENKIQDILLENKGINYTIHQIMELISVKLKLVIHGT